jgi:hypothetical protein
MKSFLFVFILVIINSTAYSQNKFENSADKAYQNAKKGVYWVLSNIPQEKSRISNDLISNNKLIASVKLYKKINGVEITSVGHYKTTEVQIKFYMSNDSLKADGYLEKDKKN